MHIVVDGTHVVITIYCGLSYLVFMATWLRLDQPLSRSARRVRSQTRRLYGYSVDDRSDGHQSSARVEYCSDVLHSYENPSRSPRT